MTENIFIIYKSVLCDGVCLFKEISEVQRGVSLSFFTFFFRALSYLGFQGQKFCNDTDRVWCVFLGAIFVSLSNVVLRKDVQSVSV